MILCLVLLFCVLDVLWCFIACVVLAVLLACLGVGCLVWFCVCIVLLLVFCFVYVGCSVVCGCRLGRFCVTW